MKESDRSTKATPPQTGRAAEEALHALILDECVDDHVLDYLLPEGQPNAWECSIWDYKLKLPNTSGRGTADEIVESQDAIAELIKDVVAFHNAFGGYVLFGINHNTATPLIGCSNIGLNGFTVEKLNDQLRVYTNTKLLCRFRSFSLGEPPQQLGLLVVPMRKPDEPVVRMIRGAPERPNGKVAFRKGEIFARLDDASTPILADAQALQFVCSPRTFRKNTVGSISIENNLPPRDPNVVRFVGRMNYLLQLWTWLTDRHTPVKVLTALGGTGKTAIAFEFCRQLISSPTGWLTKVIWLTGKKQTFSAVHGQYVAATRTDFETVDGFFRSLAGELGHIVDETSEVLGREELLDLVLEGLRMFPSLVVVDDVDSLSLAEQSDLFATIQILAGRAFESGSRFLLTSRLELSSGDSQRIEVQGFAEGEFAEYAKVISGERNIRLDDGVINRMYRASLGSPIFCTSIVRLVSLGADINVAISRWKGREGEDVRRFAFERELAELTDSEARTLFALSALGQTTQIELKQVLNVDDGQITKDLAKLRDFHLFASSGDPSTGTRLEVPEPIRLMSPILREKLHDPVRIETECARARKHVPKVQDKIAARIASVLALWKADDYDAALLTARQVHKENPKSGDLLCVLGQSLLKVVPAKPEDADKIFRKAFQFGCGRPELAPNWFEAKYLLKDWNGIIDLSSKIPPSDVRGGPALVVVEAMIELARQRAGRDDMVRAASEMKVAMVTASAIIFQGRAGDRIVEIRDRCRAAAQYYVHYTVQICTRPGDKIDVFGAAIDAFDAHVTETWIVESGLGGINGWLDDIDSRKHVDVAVVDIIRRRLGDLRRMKKHIEQLGAGRPALVVKILGAERRLSDRERKYSQNA